MAAIRRLYFYAIAFISLEVVLWGVIGLARSFFTGTEIGSDATRLAGALSLILVALPFFLVHWIIIQRSASRDIEERSARLRAIFLYGTLAATLVPAAQNALALVNRILLTWLGSDPQLAMLGRSQTASDNLSAIALNLIAAAYFFTILRQDWSVPVEGDNFPEIRRLYRYLWLVYSLAYVISGVQQISRYLLTVLTASSGQIAPSLANGLSLLILGVPLWLYTWRILVRASSAPEERESLIRQATLHGIVFISLVGSIAACWQILVSALQVLFGGSLDPADFLQEVTRAVSLAIPLLGICLYYARVLRQEKTAVAETPPFELLRQLYLYVLSLLGLAVTFSGLYLLLNLLVELWAGSPTDVLLGELALRNRLAIALATVIVGLPVWSLSWREITNSAAQPGEPGEKARRSLVRKTYLYFVLFASVLGVMFAIGQLLFQLISAALGEPAPDLLIQVLQALKTMALSLLLLVYHWRILRRDSRLAETTFSRRRIQFPVLILDPGKDGFAESLLAALKSQGSDLPVAVHPITQGAPDETLSAAKAVILPGGQLLSLPEAVRLWLHSYPGYRLVVPSHEEGLAWIGETGRSADWLARQAAMTARRLAEGDLIQTSRRTTWMTLVYILAGLFVIEILLVLAVLFLSLLTG